MLPADRNRVVRQLLSAGWVTAEGETRARRYVLTPRGRVEARYNLVDYIHRPPAERAQFRSIQPAFFELVAGSLPSPILESFGIRTEHYSFASAEARKELQRFIIDFSWKSSASEGNTYTVLETESLLTEGRPAAGHTASETAMVFNHKQAFDHIWEHLAD